MGYGRRPQTKKEELQENSFIRGIFYVIIGILVSIFFDKIGLRINPYIILITCFALSMYAYSTYTKLKGESS